MLRFLQEGRLAERQKTDTGEIQVTTEEKLKITEQEDLLFDNLKKSYPQAVPDGVVDVDKFLKAPYRIVYILKEVNSKDGNNPFNNESDGLLGFLKKGGRSQTWDNVARWTEAILSEKQNISWKEFSCMDNNKRQSALRKIAVVNLKKTPGGHTSDKKEFINAAVVFKDIVQKQLDLYKPDYIILCGTRSVYETFYNNKTIKWRQTERGINYFTDNETIIIDFSHPEARVRDNYLFYALLDAINEIRTKTEIKA